MITGWRITRSEYSTVSAFDGEGARKYGGRWNQVGTPLVYLAESRALAVLEVLVHADADLIAKPYHIIPISMKADMIMKPDFFPDNWETDTLATQAFGSKWANDLESLAIKVPSAVVPGESNYILNPNHPDFRLCAIGEPESFRFDSRLVLG